jgi:tight adherence protein B
MTGQGLDPATLALFAAALLAVGTVLFLIRASVGGDRRKLKSRLARASGQTTAVRRTSSSGQYASLRRDQSSDRLKQIDALARRFVPRPQALRDRLARTGKRITIGQYALICVGTAVAVTLLRVMLLNVPPMIGILIGIAAGIGLPHMWVSHLGKRRIKRFVGQFPDAIDLIVRGLKSGLPTQESMRIVGTEFGDPIGTEFRRISDSVRIGQTLEDALWETAKRLDTAEFRFFCISLSVQRETGGNLAETLDNLSDILRKRRQLGLKIKAMSSEARASAMILGSLPFLMFVVLYFVSGNYVLQLFQDMRGLMMVGAGLFSLGVGVFVMSRMVKFQI